jgi:hypothetical protein
MCTPTHRITAPFSPLDMHPSPSHLASPQTPHLTPPPFPAHPALKPTRPDSPQGDLARPANWDSMTRTARKYWKIKHERRKRRQTPRGQTAHPLSYSTLTTQRKERRRNQDCGMPKRDYATKQTDQHDARLKKPTRHLIRGCRGKERFATPAPAGPSMIPLVAPSSILTPSRSPHHAHAHANMPNRHRRRYRRF